MNVSESIKEMLIMQAELNESTNGPDWRNGRTTLGKEIDWRRCIVMETAELIDSYPWKHWKSVDATADMENVRVELVDIWHFLMSLALEHFELTHAQALLAEAYTDSTNSQWQAPSAEQSTALAQVRVHEIMMATALQNSAVTPEYLTSLAEAFFHSCQVADLSLERLHQLYMAKNVLNRFRQDHGYKEGTYIKIWNGKEDNVVMFEIIETLMPFSGEGLYKSLKELYLDINNGNEQKN